MMEIINSEGRSVRRISWSQLIWRGKTFNSCSEEHVTGIQSVIRFVKEKDPEDSYINGFKFKGEIIIIPVKSRILLILYQSFIYILDHSKRINITLPLEG
jgi:hypothetical protein